LAAVRILTAAAKHQHGAGVVIPHIFALLLGQIMLHENGMFAALHLYMSMFDEDVVFFCRR
jgi:hypothetical protein